MIGELIGLILGRRVDLRRNEKLRQDGKTHASVRVVSGAVRGLTQQWLPGDWVVAAGELALWRTRVSVEALGEEPRRVTGREAWSVNPEAHIYSATSGSAVIEIALMPEQSAWVIATLAGTREPGT